MVEIASKVKIKKIPGSQGVKVKDQKW